MEKNKMRTILRYEIELEDFFVKNGGDDTLKILTKQITENTTRGFNFEELDEIIHLSYRKFYVTDIILSDITANTSDDQIIKIRIKA